MNNIFLWQHAREAAASSKRQANLSLSRKKIVFISQFF
jgi:hypothetical protein